VSNTYTRSIDEKKPGEYPGLFVGFMEFGTNSKFKNPQDF
jgi:hypothetical protein